MTSRRRLKVCGITQARDYETCCRLGVDAIGINLWPKSKRYVSVSAAQGFLGRPRRDDPQRIGVFVDAPVDQVVHAYEALHLDAIQPHGDAPSEAYAALGLPWVWVIRGTPDLGGLAVPTPEPRWILLDAAVAGFGGAGRQTDWQWAAAAVKQLAPRAVWLAGGIEPGNARRALEMVAPAGLDVASGAEIDGTKSGQKDAAKIEALMSACRGAEAL